MLATITFAFSFVGIGQEAGWSDIPSFGNEVMRHVSVLRVLREQLG